LKKIPENNEFDPVNDDQTGLHRQLFTGSPLFATVIFRGVLGVIRLFLLCGNEKFEMIVYFLD
jgi:hypothetical protein